MGWLFDTVDQLIKFGLAGSQLFVATSPVNPVTPPTVPRGGCARRDHSTPNVLA
jgi:hypothetical protein